MLRAACEAGCAAVLLWLESLAAYAVIRLMPADPAVLTLLAFNQPMTDVTVGALRTRWGLDRPLVEQNLRWLGDFCDRPLLLLTSGFAPIALCVALRFAIGGDDGERVPANSGDVPAAVDHEKAEAARATRPAAAE